MTLDQDERREFKHIESIKIPEDPEQVERPPVEIVEQAHGGALQVGNPTHGLGFRGRPGPEIQARAAEVREMLSRDYAGKLDGLSMPTVEILCQTWAEADLYSQTVMEYAAGTRSRTVNKRKMTGIEACPQWIALASIAAKKELAKMLQDIGLDLTGRAKALKDEAIINYLDPGADIQSLAGSSRRFRRLQ